MTYRARTSSLVIDLTDTPSGGNTSVARAIMSWFVDRPRSYQVHKVVNPSADGPQPESEEQTVLLRRAEVDEWDDIEIYPPRTCSYDYVPLPEAPRHLRAD